MKIFGVTFVSFLFTPSESRISVNFGNDESTTIGKRNFQIFGQIWSGRGLEWNYYETETEVSWI